MRAWDFSFSNDARVMIDGEVAESDVCGLGGAWETRLKAGFSVIGVKVGLVFGTMRKRGRVWAS